MPESPIRGSVCKRGAPNAREALVLACPRYAAQREGKAYSVSRENTRAALWTVRIYSERAC